MRTDRIPPVAGAVFKPRAVDLPTRREAFLFSLKAVIFRLRRSLENFFGDAPRVLARPTLDPALAIIAESRSPLYAEVSPSEWALQAGKVQNLRLAARALNGLVVPQGKIFSFWANLGRATRGRGFVQGRELREGCVIPNIGGGLCQISNALYDVALQAGLEIVERHAHSRQVPGAGFAGRDATVFWNYVDLRFRAAALLRITVELSASELVVRLHSQPAAALRPVFPPAPVSLAPIPGAASCETCGLADCFRHAAAVALPRHAGAAWMVDAFSPEIESWIAGNRGPDDSLLLPLASQRLRLGPYHWSTKGFAKVRQVPLTVVRRSLASRRLSSQGAARQQALLAMDEEMARALARHLPPLATHLNISQNLLPFLWRDGLLGGRTFDVLMTRYPLHEMQSILDRAALAHPDSPTLGDFRAPGDVVCLEKEALAAARTWITPHTSLAALAGDRARLVEWKTPSAPGATRGRSIVFPASTLGRKGAYELREAVRSLSAPLRVGGPILERLDFWQGLDVSRAGPHWLEDAAVVVLPAWLEHQPRRLLYALAAGVPVIASEACGLPPAANLIRIPTGDAGALREALESVLSGSTSQPAAVAELA